MSKITTYTCDRCGKTSTRNDFLEAIAIVRDANHNSDRIVQVYPASCVLIKGGAWCQECLKELRLLRPGEERRLTATEEEVPAPVSLEDIIREIVREEIEDQ